MCCWNLIIIIIICITIIFFNIIIIIINNIILVVVVVVVVAALWVLSPKSGEVVGWTVWAGWVVESPVGGAQSVQQQTAG